jgi:hypothetical protein
VIKCKSIGILILILILTGCAWLDKSEHVKIIGDYEVGWNDLVRNRCISKTLQKCEGCFETIIENYVYEVGHNENFIIAKQHPGIDTVIINYYIIDIKENERAARTGIYGPLSLNEFNGLKVKLKISDLSFDPIYAENL